MLDSDPHHPGHFGFDHWLTVTNFFDMNPVMSCMGKFEDFKGDSSEIIVAESLKFIKQKKDDGKPFLTVIWYGSPHSPWVASRRDQIKGRMAGSGRWTCARSAAPNAARSGGLRSSSAWRPTGGLSSSPSAGSSSVRRL